MNEWHENLHPRGGDQEHPGRFSAGHGGGRHYNPPPGQEHLAMRHEEGGKRLRLDEKTHMYPSATHWHAENLRAAVMQQEKGRRKDMAELDRLCKFTKLYEEKSFGSAVLSTATKKRGAALISRLSKLRQKIAADYNMSIFGEFDVSNSLNLFKDDIDRVNKEDGPGTDDERLSQFEKDGFRVDPRDRESHRILAENRFIEGRRTNAKKWLLGVVNFNIHHKAMSVVMHYHDGERAHCSMRPKEVPHHHRLPDGSSVLHDGYVPMSVTMGAKSFETSYIHEYGHAIEGFSSEAHEMCVDFLKRRRRPGEKLKKMMDLNPPKDFDFAPDEVGFDDKFARVFRAVGFPKKNSAIQGRYTGKDYGGYGYGAGTEVLSKGLELLYKDSAKFAKVDPEWFNLVVGIATGNSLVATRHNAEEDRHKAGEKK